MATRGKDPGGGEEPTDPMTANEIETIANPLTVLRGYTQLLQRRIRRGRYRLDDDILRPLAVMDAAARSATEGLDALVERRRRDDDVDAQAIQSPVDGQDDPSEIAPSSLGAASDDI